MFFSDERGKERFVALDLDAYYRKHGPMVLRRCRKLLKNEEKAVDALHDVFVELVRRRDRLDGAAPAALLQRPEDLEEDLLVRIACAPDADFDRESESTRAIAVMRLLDGMTLEEVAREVGLSVSGIRKRLRTMKARVAEPEVQRWDL